MSDIPTPLLFVDPNETDDRPHPAMSRADVRRFFAKVDIRSKDECWLWTAAIGTAGYPQFHFQGAEVAAHRLMCVMFYGAAPGLQALHSCDTPSCVNPYHLRWGTIADNMRDRFERERCARGERQGVSRLTEDDVRAIRIGRLNGESLGCLALRYGVSKTTISCIERRKTWRHVA